MELENGCLDEFKMKLRTLTDYEENNIVLFKSENVVISVKRLLELSTCPADGRAVVVLRHRS